MLGKYFGIAFKLLNIKYLGQHSVPRSDANRPLTDPDGVYGRKMRFWANCRLTGSYPASTAGLVLLSRRVELDCAIAIIVAGLFLDHRQS